MLNLLLGTNLKPIVSKGSTAVDMADYEKRLAVEITANNRPAKVRQTLERFLDNRLDQYYDRLIILVLTGSKLPIRDIVLQQRFEFSVERDVWSLQTLLMQICDLEDTEVIQEISMHLEQFMHAVDAKKPTHMLPSVLPLSESFVGREREVEELHRMTNSQEPVYICGMGGMGKTQVAIRYAQQYTPPKGSYFVHYTLPHDTEKEAMRETILHMHIDGYHFRGRNTDSREEEYQERLKILAEEYCGALLIVDNFEWPGKSLEELQSEKSFQDLTKLGIKLILTTRYSVKSNAVKLGPLSEQELLHLMKISYTDGDAEENDLQALIREVNGHTLMVELMAKTMDSSWGIITPQDMLNNLRRSELKEMESPSVVAEKDGRFTQARLYEHLRMLFSMTGMTEKVRNVLSYATLLPNDGMSKSLFMSGMGNIQGEGSKDANQIVKNLVDHRWLYYGRMNRLMIHPVIREVCREELNPSDSSCGEFLERLRQELKEWTQHGRYDKDQYSQLAKCYSVAADNLEDRKGNWELLAGWLWHRLGQHPTALHYELRLVDKFEKDPSTDRRDLSTAYSNVGSSYGDMGDNLKALEYKKKALVILEKTPMADYRSLARAYNNLGSTCSRLGNHEKALEYQVKALSIQEQILQGGHPGLAVSYSNVGLIYRAMGDREKALEYAWKAMEIREKALSADHPDLARSYDNIGIAYGELGDYAKAMEYLKKALGIREKVLPRHHPDLARSYTNMAGVYQAWQDWKRALEYQLKALIIQENILPNDHPDLLQSYENVATAYRAVGDRGKSLEYLLKVILIQQESLSPEHMMLARSYCNVASLYEQMEALQKAQDYYLKSREIFEKILPMDHPDLEEVNRAIVRCK